MVKTGKCIIGIVLTLVLLLTMCLATALPVSAGGMATVAIPNVTLDEDASFTLPLNISGSYSDLNAFNIDLVVDTDTLTLTGVTSGSLTGTGWTFLISARQTGGTYPGKDWWGIVGYAGPGIGVNGDGSIATLAFTANETFTNGENTALNLENCTLSDKNADPITSTLADGTATVDLLEVAAVDVDGDNIPADNEGYVNPGADATTFTLTPTVTGGSGTYNTYAWTFGTDSSGTTAAVAPSDVTYSSNGTKTITLTVTDSHGSTSTFSVGTISAEIYANLVAGFSGTPEKGIVKYVTDTWVSTTQHSSTVAFTDATAGGKPANTYSWDFNSDSTEDSAVANPSKNFADFANATGAGFEGAEYDVVLTVDDSLIADDDETKADYIAIYVAGDVNGDFELGAADLTMIARVIVLMEGDTYDFTSDTNDDGAINALDITATALLVI
ncbi:MAG: cohesin domain-containing protein [Dehalococcoidales bacterium]|nr:cohesin domain-containing protein [Dehalococcoidales bacterium]